jgi:hypothetical protein
MATGVVDPGGMPSPFISCAIPESSGLSGPPRCSNLTGRPDRRRDRCPGGGRSRRLRNAKCSPPPVAALSPEGDGCERERRKSSVGRSIVAEPPWNTNWERAIVTGAVGPGGRS